MNNTDIQVIFIIPEHCKDESHTHPIMREAFELAKDSMMITKWMYSSEGYQLNGLKTNFIVFETFSGPLFESVRKTNSTIIGPACLVHCLMDVKQIPPVEWPIYCFAMEGCVVTASNINKMAKQEVENKVKMMGGRYSMNLSEDTTHLITGCVNSDKYCQATSRGCKIYQTTWIDALWELCQNHQEIDLNNEQLDTYKCPAFYMLEICLTGFEEEKERLIDLITKNGGKYTARLQLKSADVLVCKSTVGQKYKAAKKNQLSCVTADWVYESVIVGYCLPVEQFAPKVTVSTPERGSTMIDLDISAVSTINSMNAGSNQSVFQETINGTMLKRKSPHQPTPQADIDGIDIKRAKRAGAFLDGCNIFLVGFSPEHQDKLCKILNYSGAMRSEAFNKHVTHIVVGDTRAREFRALQTNQNLNNCAMVSTEWILQCLEMGHSVKTDDYRIGESIVMPSVDKSKAKDGMLFKSPLTKKTLSFLKADTSTLSQNQETLTEPEENTMEQDQHAEEPENADIMSQYIQPLGMPLPEANVNQQTTFKNQTTSKENDESSPSITMSETATSQQINIFKTKNFYLRDDVTENKHREAIATKIEECGGSTVPSASKAHYIVAPTFLSKQDNANKTTLVTAYWIDECHDTLQLIEDLVYYHKPLYVQAMNPSMFAGCVFTFSNYQGYERVYLRHTVQLFGALAQDQLARNAVPDKQIRATTHLISSSNEGKKFEAALKWGLVVVGKDWIFACIQAGMLVDVRDFLLVEPKAIGGSTSMVCETPLPQQRSSAGPLIKTPKSRLDILKASERTPRSPRTPPKEVPRNTDSADVTPKSNGTPVFSQITPVAQIMAKANIEPSYRSFDGDQLEKPDVETPNRPPQNWEDIDTPDTPYGAFIENPPPAELRKKMLKWINHFPEVKQRRMSTPLSELKRRLWDQICPDFKMAPLNFDEISDDEVCNKTNTSQTSIHNDTENTSLHAAGVATENKENPGTPVCVVNEKLQQLESMAKSMSNSASRRGSLISLCTEEQRPSTSSMKNGCANLLSQPYSIGWDENLTWDHEAKSNTRAASTTSTNSPPFFMITGADDRETLIEKIEQLGGSASALANYDPSATHLLCNRLNRNEKFLAAMASGKWILDLSYIDDSLKAGKFLPEEQYEFGNPRCKIKVDLEVQQRANSAHFWRKTIASRHYGAFHDIRALVFASKRDPLIRVIKAGDGVVIDENPPFENNINATHCFLEMKPGLQVDDFIPLATQGIYIVDNIFINEFLHRTVEDIKNYIIPYFTKYY